MMGLNVMLHPQLLAVFLAEPEIAIRDGSLPAQPLQAGVEIRRRFGEECLQVFRFLLKPVLLFRSKTGGIRQFHPNGRLGERACFRLEMPAHGPREPFAKACGIGRRHRIRETSGILDCGGQGGISGDWRRRSAESGLRCGGKRRFVPRRRGNVKGSWLFSRFRILARVFRAVAARQENRSERENRQR